MVVCAPLTALPSNGLASAPDEAKTSRTFCRKTAAADGSGTAFVKGNPDT
jgi:hypothetical protein